MKIWVQIINVHYRKKKHFRCSLQMLSLQILRNTFARPSRDPRVITALSAIAIANHVQTDRLISCNDFPKVFLIFLTHLFNQLPVWICQSLKKSNFKITKICFNFKIFLLKKNYNQKTSHNFSFWRYYKK